MISILTCVPGDVEFGNDEKGHRLMIPLYDLTKAIEENNLEEVVEKAVEPVYGPQMTKPMFDIFVQDIVQSIRQGIVNSLRVYREGRNDKFAILFNENNYLEPGVKIHGSDSINYWFKEKC